MEGKRFERWPLVALAALVVAAIPLLRMLRVGSPPLSEAPAPATAPGELLHAAGELTMRWERSGPVLREKIELWFDDATRNSRFASSTFGYEEMGLRLGETVQRSMKIDAGPDGTRQSNPHTTVMTDTVSADDPAARVDEGMLDGRILRLDGELQLAELQREMVDGRELIKLPSSYVDELANVPAERQVAVWLEPEQLLMARIEYWVDPGDLEVGPPDGERDKLIVSYDYDRIEIVPADEVPIDLWRLVDLDTNQVTRRTRSLDLEQARAYPKFKLYYLGERFQDLELSAIVETIEDVRGRGLRKGSDPVTQTTEVRIEYMGQGRREPVVSLMLVDAYGYVSYLDSAFATIDELPDGSRYAYADLGPHVTLQYSIEDWSGDYDMETEIDVQAPNLDMGIQVLESLIPLE